MVDNTSVWSPGPSGAKSERSAESDPGHTNTMTVDRRHSPRIELLGRLHGHSVSLDVAVSVLEISLGGMAIQTGLPFPTGAVQAFRLTLGDDSTVELSGRVMHCRNVASSDAIPSYVTGLQFVDDEPADAGPSVGDLIERIT
jgi:PilZ domain